MNVFFNKIKPYIQFTKNQQRGILVLFAIIIIVQAAFFLLNFNIVKTENKEAQKWLSQQNNLDSLKQEQPSNSYKIYPFNPNFITDFKGYKLGMKPEEINRLLAYRKQYKFVNSAKEFQQITGVSDSLLRTIAPYFKFPDWVNKKNSQQNYNDQYHSNWKEYPKKETLKILDISQATKEDLMKIYGVGDAMLLDLALDYRVMADRIIHGTLGEVLAAAGHPLPDTNPFAHGDPLADVLPDEAEALDEED